MGDIEMLCALAPCLLLKISSPQAGLEPSPLKSMSRGSYYRLAPRPTKNKKRKMSDINEKYE